MPVSEKTGIFPEFRGGVPMYKMYIERLDLLFRHICQCRNVKIFGRVSKFQALKISGINYVQIDYLCGKRGHLLNYVAAECK